MLGEVLAPQFRLIVRDQQKPIGCVSRQICENRAKVEGSVIEQLVNR